MAEIKIMIVDDHEMVRDGLSVMMEREEDFMVVGEAQNGLEAVPRPSHLCPLLGAKRTSKGHCRDFAI